MKNLKKTKRTDNRNVAPLYSSYMFLVSVASAKCMMTVGDGQLVHMYEYEYGINLRHCNASLRYYKFFSLSVFFIILVQSHLASLFTEKII